MSAAQVVFLYVSRIQTMRELALTTRGNVQRQENNRDFPPFKRTTRPSTITLIWVDVRETNVLS